MKEESVLSIKEVSNKEDLKLRKLGLRYWKRNKTFLII